MIKKIIYIYLIFVIANKAYSQDNRPPYVPLPLQTNQQGQKDFNNFKERLYFGGNVGAWFGPTTYINLSPLVGCKITKKFSLGVGFTYNYYSQTYQNHKYTYTVYGGNGFARYMVLDNVFLQVGLDRLSVLDYTSPIPNSRAWVNNILLGGGYRQAFSQRGSFVAAIFYNINQTPLSPYQNPIIQIGFNFGL